MSGNSSVDEGEYYSPVQSQNHMQGDPNDAHSQGSYSPLFLSQDRSPAPPIATSEVSTAFAIHVPPVERPWEYADYEDKTVDEVLSTIGSKSSKYSVRLVDGRKLTVSEYVQSNNYAVLKLAYIWSGEFLSITQT